MWRKMVDPKNTATEKYGGGSTIIKGCFSANHSGASHTITETWMEWCTGRVERQRYMLCYWTVQYGPCGSVHTGGFTVCHVVFLSFIKLPYHIADYTCIVHLENLCGLWIFLDSLSVICMQIWKKCKLETGNKQ